MPGHLYLTDGTRVSPSAELTRWTSALAAARLTDHIVTLTGALHPPPIMAPVDRGSWAVGAYAGTLTLDGLQLELQPRVGWAQIGDWVRAATDLAGCEFGGVAAETAVMDRLVAMFWTRAVDGASRHGPPAFRREVPQTGATIRGRLDVRRTVRMRSKGDTAVASLYRRRELDNPVTRAIVAADRVLVRQVGHGRWRTQRVEAVLPQLHVAVGRRAPVPGDGELQRMRYTPITRAFKSAAELSARIVRQDPIATTPPPGRVQGLVIDLAGVWTGAALTWLRAARPDLRIDLAEDGQINVGDDERKRASVSVRPAPESAAIVMEVRRPGSEAAAGVLPAEAAAAEVVVQSAANGL